jgi:hypothetical protein
MASHGVIIMPIPDQILHRLRQFRLLAAYAEGSSVKLRRCRTGQVIKVGSADSRQRRK